MALIAKDNNGGDSDCAGYGIIILEAEDDSEDLEDLDGCSVDSLYFDYEETPNWNKVRRFLKKHKVTRVVDTANPEDVYDNIESYIKAMSEFYAQT